MKQIIKLIGVIFLLLSLTNCSTPEQEIYLTRHAEKLKDSHDPSLSAEGKLRAQNLAMFLKSKNIKVIYSTKYNRTIETAKPLADLLNLEIQYYDPSALEEFAQQIKNKKENMLIVGHSNTTPAMVHYLGGEQGEEMPETEYDRLYQLKIKKGKVFTKIIRKTIK